MKELLNKLVNEERFLLTRNGEVSLDTLSPNLQKELAEQLPPEILGRGLEKAKWYLEAMARG